MSDVQFAEQWKQRILKEQLQVFHDKGEALRLYRKFLQKSGSSTAPPPSRSTPAQPAASSSSVEREARLAPLDEEGSGKVGSVDRIGTTDAASNAPAAAEGESLNTKEELLKLVPTKADRAVKWLQDYDPDDVSVCGSAASIRSYRTDRSYPSTVVSDVSTNTLLKLEELELMLLEERAKREEAERKVDMMRAEMGSSRGSNVPPRSGSKQMQEERSSSAMHAAAQEVLREKYAQQQQRLNSRGSNNSRGHSRGRLSTPLIGGGQAQRGEAAFSKNITRASLEQQREYLLSSHGGQMLNL
uniref:Uncharacterized protein n=1 Tax=Palpitomonas bilix TaxID=652834 RepID=A0A7S3GHN9_9EUKA|mmetsp:Transcript_49929/g.128476  ORF Transcript_49929/g.128476 Transcript_49929/m.128476 type:complete len:300 (+) Transcript_49929:205-1104(+)